MNNQSTQLKHAIQSSEALELMKEGKEFIFLDIRMKVELTEFGWIPNSEHIEMAKFNNNSQDEIRLLLDTKQQIIVYCSGGGRSLVVAKKLREWGISAFSLSDGYFGWAVSGGKIETQFTN